MTRAKELSMKKASGIRKRKELITTIKNAKKQTIKERDIHGKVFNDIKFYDYHISATTRRSANVLIQDLRRNGYLARKVKRRKFGRNVFRIYKFKK